MPEKRHPFCYYRFGQEQAQQKLVMSTYVICERPAARPRFCLFGIGEAIVGDFVGVCNRLQKRSQEFMDQQLTHHEQKTESYLVPFFLGGVDGIGLLCSSSSSSRVLWDTKSEQSTIVFEAAREWKNRRTLLKVRQVAVLHLARHR